MLSRRAQRDQTGLIHCQGLTKVIATGVLRRGLAEKVQVLKTLAASYRRKMLIIKSASRRTRTYNQEIKSLLLYH